MSFTSKLRNKIYFNERSALLYNGRHATRGWGEGGYFTCPFFKIKKIALILEKKGPNCIHPWIKSSIQNVVLRLSRRKSSRIFPCEAFFSCVFEEWFIEVP